MRKITTEIIKSFNDYLIMIILRSVLFLRGFYHIMQIM